MLMSEKVGKNVLFYGKKEIGKNSVIQDNVIIGSSDDGTNDKYMMYGGAELKGPIIKKGAKIGANSTILPGIVVGEGAIIGAGSVVTKDVKNKEVVAGVPIKVLRRKK